MLENEYRLQNIFLWNEKKVIGVLFLTFFLVLFIIQACVGKDMNLFSIGVVAVSSLLLTIACFIIYFTYKIIRVPNKRWERNRRALRLAHKERKQELNDTQTLILKAYCRKGVLEQYPCWIVKNSKGDSVWGSRYILSDSALGVL